MPFPAQRSMFALCCLLALAATVGAQAQYVLCTQVIGVGLTVQFLFLLVLSLAVSMGLLLPQWLVGALSWHSTRRPHRLWLPNKPADQMRVTAVLLIGTIVFVVLNVGMVVAFPLLAAWNAVFTDRFLLGLWTLRGADAIWLTLVIAPSWIAAGFMLAVLHRSMLTADRQQYGKPSCEEALPGYLIIGALAALTLNHVFSFATRYPQASIYVAQLLMLAPVIVMAYRMPATLRRSTAIYKASTARLETVGTPKTPAATIVVAVAVGVASLAVLTVHVMLLAFGLHASAFDKLMLAALFLWAVGAEAARQRRVGRHRPSQHHLAFWLLIAATVALLSMPLGATLCRRRFVLLDLPAPIAPMDVFCQVSLVVVGVIGLVAGGAALRLGKEMIEAAVISKALAWARWIALTAVAALLGGCLVARLLLIAYGWPMALAVSALLVLLVAGLLFIYAPPGRRFLRRIAVTVVFLLVILSSIAAPLAGKKWLGSAGRAAPLVQEDVGAAWLLSKTYQPDALLTVDLLSAPPDMSAPEVVRRLNERRRLAQNLSTLASRVLVVAPSAMLWPMPPSEPMNLDVLVPHALAQSLRERQSKDSIGQLSALSFVSPCPRVLSRIEPGCYDVVCLVAEPECSAPLEDISELLACLQPLMPPDGMVVIQVEAAGSVPVASLARHWGDSTGGSTAVLLPAARELESARAGLIVVTDPAAQPTGGSADIADLPLVKRLARSHYPAGVSIASDGAALRPH